MYANFFVPLAHIYNMCKEEGVVSAEWPDLEFLLKHCSEKAFFRGPGPIKSQRLEYADRIGYMTGIYAKKGMRMISKGLWPVVDEIKHTSLRLAAMPLATILFDRTRHADGFDDQDAQRTVLIIRATVEQITLGRPQKPVDMAADSSINNPDDLTKWAARAPAVSIAQVLGLAQQRLEHELQFLEFGLHQVKKACLLLITRLTQL